MNETEFCYWLNGYFEISGATELDPEQVKMVKEHLALVFEKVTEEKTSPKKMAKTLTSWDKDLDLTGGGPKVCSPSPGDQKYCLQLKPTTRPKYKTLFKSENPDS